MAIFNQELPPMSCLAIYSQIEFFRLKLEQKIDIFY